MRELDLITDTIQEQTQTDCEIIWGVCKDESLGDDIGITLVATGFQSGESSKERRQVQRQQEEKVVYTLQTKPLENKIEQVQPKVEETKKVEEKPVIIDVIKVENTQQNDTADDDLFKPIQNINAEKENEIEFEINLNQPEFDIKIVDKPRMHIVNELEDNLNKSSVDINTADSQFTLFETNTTSNKIADDVDDQSLERDLIKKRITLDMQKHHISLYELEKEPAYKRYGMNLDSSTPSEQSNFSNYMIYNNSEDPTKIEIRPNAMKDITLD
jgi:cell division protein FtsZ